MIEYLVGGTNTPRILIPFYDWYGFDWRTATFVPVIYIYINASVK